MLVTIFHRGRLALIKREELLILVLLLVLASPNLLTRVKDVFNSNECSIKVLNIKWGITSVISFGICTKSKKYIYHFQSAEIIFYVQYLLRSPGQS